MNITFTFLQGNSYPDFTRKKEADSIFYNIITTQPDNYNANEKKALRQLAVETFSHINNNTNVRFRIYMHDRTFQYKIGNGRNLIIYDIQRDGSEHHHMQITSLQEFIDYVWKNKVYTIMKNST